MANRCRACGICCTLFLVNLNETEYKSGSYKTVFEDCGMIKSFSKARSWGANIVAQHEDGSCIYLKNHLCSVHKNRPQVCRKFFCTSKNKRFKDMIKMIEAKRLKMRIGG